MDPSNNKTFGRRPPVNYTCKQRSFGIRPETHIYSEWIESTNDKWHDTYDPLCHWFWGGTHVSGRVPVLVLLPLWWWESDLHLERSLHVQGVVCDVTKRSPSTSNGPSSTRRCQTGVLDPVHPVHRSQHCGSTVRYLVPNRLKKPISRSIIYKNLKYPEPQRHCRRVETEPPRLHRYLLSIYSTGQTQGYFEIAICVRRPVWTGYPTSNNWGRSHATKGRKSVSVWYRS